MANIDDPNGFTCVGSLTGEIVTRTVTLAGTVAKGDSLVAASGTATIGLSNSGLILGVAAEAGVSGDEILYYPAVPWLIFEGQCSGTYALASHMFTAVDIEGTTGIQEINEDATTEKVAQIIGINPNSEVGDHTRVRFIWVRSGFTGLEDAE